MYIGSSMYKKIPRPTLLLRKNLTMKKTMESFIVFSAALTFCGCALASDAAEPENNFSITISPLHLLVPIVLVNGEFKANNNFGVSLMLGAGTLGLAGSSASYSVRQYGFQVNFYPDSNFNEGLQYGLEVFRADIELISSSSIKASGNVFALGPYVGYKAAFDGDFILVTQFGYQVASVTATARDNNGNLASVGAGGGGLLLNLNVGFNF